MDASTLFGILFFYLCFIPALTLHELAHAWVAWKCGDNTAKSLGRISLNPIVHMELIGTVVLPLLGLYLSHNTGFLIVGWGKPVPVDPRNLRNPRRDDTLIALAGPAMNLVLAFLLTGIAVLVSATAGTSAPPVILNTLQSLVGTNLMLAFFNLMPIPPLDGSHVIKNLINMSYETYWRLTQYGLFVVLLVINIPVVQATLSKLAYGTANLFLRAYTWV